jgi:hypothetical protein
MLVRKLVYIGKYRDKCLTYMLARYLLHGGFLLGEKFHRNEGQVSYPRTQKSSNYKQIRCVECLLPFGSGYFEFLSTLYKVKDYETSLQLYLMICMVYCSGMLHPRRRIVSKYAAYTGAATNTQSFSMEL